MTLPSPVAVVHGKPLEEVPAALYIPPKAMRIHLQAFEGPLDLLLFLVRKHRFDIMNIHMTTLCRQYAAYMEEVLAEDLEMAADYLAMSALLVEIKTKMLLPRPADEDEEGEDPRADLVARLLEYERIRKAAEHLSQLPRRGRDFFSPRLWVDKPPPVKKPVLQVLQLLHALSTVILRQKHNADYQISTETLSVREVMSNIMRRLVARVRTAFSALSEPGRGGVTFMAVLQLAMEKMVRLHQENDDDELHIEPQP